LDIPPTLASYTQERAVLDAVAVMDGLIVDQARVVGLSMGSFTALHLGLDYSRRTFSLTIAGAGYGCEKHLDGDRAVCLDVAEKFENEGAAAFASAYGESASRVQFQHKDPRGWREFVDRLARPSDLGSALTMRGIQARRASFWDIEVRLKEMRVPTLIVVGDDDDHCVTPGIFLKRNPRASPHEIIRTRSAYSLPRAALKDANQMIHGGAHRRRFAQICVYRQP
jgi:pimeloyl-ACP methyl ester carboxylesterase